MVRTFELLNQTDALLAATSGTRHHKVARKTYVDRR